MMNSPAPFGDFFALFDLPRRFSLDPAALESAYLGVQARIHPDRFAHLPENERRVSMQWASHANEAFRTLRRPVARARYLLQLAGHDPEVESNTAMPSDFLMRQMMLREDVEAARDVRDVDTLDALLREVRSDARSLEGAIAVEHDVRVDLAAMAARTRQLMFLERLEEDILNAIETLEN